MLQSIGRCMWLLYSLYRLSTNETEDNAARVREAAKHCNAIGIKLVQFLASHDGFLSAEYQEKFHDLYEQCDTHSWDDTVTMYYDDFERDIYDDFDIAEDDVPVPVGSGSIAQVYCLHHRHTHQKVAVKVKHPNIDKIASQFLQTLRFTISGMKKLGITQMTPILQEFIENIAVQLDYKQEAKNTMMFREHFAEEKHIIIPEILETSDNFIIMTYHDGTSFLQIEDKHVRTRISCDMYMLNMMSLLQYDFMHCDLHIGNWKVQMEEDDKFKIVIYDCGILGSTGDKRVSREIIYSIFAGDLRKLCSIIITNPESQKEWPELSAKLERIYETRYEKNSDRLTNVMKELMKSGIALKTHLVRCAQGFMIFGKTLSLFTDKLVTILGQGGNNLDVLLVLNHAILERQDKYKPLRDHLANVIAADPKITEAFYDWLDDTFGHRDKDVLMDVIWKGLKL